MDRPRALVVIGTRPEAIKLAPVVAALRDGGLLEPRVCLTGQHRELLAQGLAAFDVPVHHNLDLMSVDQDLSALTARVLQGVADVVAREGPRWVVVQGDTTTAMAAALAAFQKDVPVAHVEAGLRSGDLAHPWPEEMNRRLVGQLATLHFAPTARARDNLIAEGVDPAAIAVTGNTGIDAVRLARRRLAAQPALGEAPGLPGTDGGRPLVVVTVHRRENLGRGLDRIAAALETIAARGDCEIVFPAHPNPAVARMAARLADGRPNLRVVPPLDYLPFVALLERARLILTDSGGIQEEASVLGRPVLLMRERTERQEAIEAGNVRLIGTRSDRICAEVDRLLTDPAAHAALARAHDAFGDGRAAERIADLLAAASAGAIAAAEPVH